MSFSSCRTGSNVTHIWPVSTLLLGWTAVGPGQNGSLFWGFPQSRQKFMRPMAHVLPMLQSV
jgi:hypothetical protein